eukprot:m.252321 g.252321  ORF g.252321 m.252321 type:complete len:834 (+) comp17186_c0_seq45:416-2917(+)
MSKSGSSSKFTRGHIGFQVAGRAGSFISLVLMVKICDDLVQRITASLRAEKADTSSAPALLHSIRAYWNLPHPSELKQRQFMLSKNSVGFEPQDDEEALQKVFKTFVEVDNEGKTRQDSANSDLRTPMPIVYAEPGAGKSFFLDRVLFHASKGTYGGPTRQAITVPVTFNIATIFDPSELNQFTTKGGLVAARILFNLLRQYVGLNPKEFLQTFSLGKFCRWLQDVTLCMAIETLRLAWHEHDKGCILTLLSQDGMDNSYLNKPVVVAVDEIMKVATHKEEFAFTLLNQLGHAQDVIPNLYFVVTTLSYGPINQFSESCHSLRRISLKGLDGVKAIQQIAKKVGQEGSLPHEIKRCILQFSGHGRGLECFGNFLFPIGKDRRTVHRDFSQDGKLYVKQNETFRDVLEAFIRVADRRQAFPWFSYLEGKPLLHELVALVVKGEQADLEKRIVIEGRETTMEELVGCGLLLHRASSPVKERCRIAFIHPVMPLAALLLYEEKNRSNHPLAYALDKMLSVHSASFDGFSFEKYHGWWEVLRRIVFAGQTITLNQFYRTADDLEDLALGQVRVKIPRIDVDDKKTWPRLVSLQSQFPTELNLAEEFELPIRRRFGSQPMPHEEEEEEKKPEEILALQEANEQYKQWVSQDLAEGFKGLPEEDMKKLLEDKHLFKKDKHTSREAMFGTLLREQDLLCGQHVFQPASGNPGFDLFQVFCKEGEEPKYFLVAESCKYIGRDSQPRSLDISDIKTSLTNTKEAFFPASKFDGQTHLAISRLGLREDQSNFQFLMLAARNTPADMKVLKKKNRWMRVVDFEPLMQMYGPSLAELPQFERREM